MTTPTVPTAERDKPDAPSAAYQAMKEGWEVCADAFEGTARMREKGSAYLPRHPLENPDEYRRRVAATEFFNGFERTVRGLVGMVFRRDLKLQDDVPAAIRADAENIDLAGTHLDLFASALLEDGLIRGHVGVLVDYPVVDDADQLSRAEERARKLRPYWVKVLPEQILSWRTTVVNGRTELTQVVIREETVEPAGEFGEQQKVQYRVLRRRQVMEADRAARVEITYQLWHEVQTGAGKTLTPGEERVIRNQIRIPLVIIHTGKQRAPLQTKPPLLDLAYTNIAHWQVKSDHRHSLHKASMPLLVFLGRDRTTDAIEVGVNAAIDIPVGGDAKYVEHAGSALGQTREELKDLESQMATQGLAMLQRETRAAETAEAKRLDKSEQDSALARAARSLQDGLEAAFEFHAAYAGEKSGGSVLVNRDFEQLTFDAQMISALSSLEVAGQVSLETLWDMLGAGNILPENFDRDLEQVRLLARQRSLEPGAGGGEGGAGAGA